MYKEDADGEIIEKAKKALVEKVKNILPHFSISTSLAMYAGKPDNFSVNNPSQKILRDTCLYYDGGFKLIHFTSLKNAIEILNNGYLYLNNLSLLDDPNEFSSGAIDLTGIPNEQIIGYKQLFYQISFCEYQDNEEVHFDNWRLYGENGKGVGLVFKVEKENFDEWSNYFLSKIVYEGQEQHSQIKQLYNSFISETKKFEVENDFQLNDRELILMRIYSFIKKGIYKSESEVRLLHYSQDTSSNNFSLSNEFHLYPKAKLYLKFEKHKNINQGIQDCIKQSSLPHINLDSMIVGYRYNETDFHKISNSLEMLIYRMTESIVKAKQSELRKFFT